MRVSFSKHVGYVPNEFLLVSAINEGRLVSAPFEIMVGSPGKIFQQTHVSVRSLWPKSNAGKGVQIRRSFRLRRRIVGPTESGESTG